MITVKVREDEISVTGHANSGPPGHDIVCASVSTLIQTLVASIEDLTEDKPDYTISKGIFDLNLKDLSTESKLLVDSFFVGVCGVAGTDQAAIQIL